MATTNSSRFSFRAFRFGLLAILGLYVVLFAYAYFNESNTFKNLESRLSSQTVLIDRAVEFDIGDSTPIQTDVGLDPGDQIAAPEDANIEDRALSEQNQDADLEDIIGQQALTLRQSPISGFYEEEARYGLLPVAKSPSQTPFEVYKKPFVLNRSKPYISVAMDNFGLSKELSEEMLATLPSTVSFILSPYSSQPEEWAQKARADGHEIWLHIPMENNAFPLSDPGSKGLLTRVSLQYNQDRLKWLLGRATGYTGIAAHTDNSLNNAGPMFQDIAKTTFARGLGFFELNTNLGSFFKPIAESTKTPQAQNDLSVDVISLQNTEIRALLSQINNQGGGVMVVSPTPRNIPVLKKWLESLQKRGIESVPVSAVAAPDLERN